jgi:hypothetical protein
MNSRFAFVFALAAACGSSSNNNNPDGGGVTITPSVSIVEPAVAFLGRTLDVHLAGYGTMWTDATTVDFGMGVKVNKVSAASDTGLTVNITVATSASEGARDIVVTDGANSESYKASFTVRSPLDVGMAVGTVAQGSIFSLHVDDADHDHPFDSTSQQGLTGATFTNLSVTAAAGITGQTNNVTPFGADFLFFVDVNANAANTDLTLVSGPPTGATTDFFKAGAVQIAARMPANLPTGATMGMVTGPLESTLYSFTPDVALTVHEIKFDASTTDQSASPFLFLLPKSGKFTDPNGKQVSGGSVPTSGSTVFATKAADPWYAVYLDSGAANYSFTITRKANPVTGATETEPNNTQAMANTVATLPALVQNADLMTGAADEDWYKITVSAADFTANKHIHVTTFAGDAGAQHAVDVLQLTGGTNTTSINTPTGPVDNAGFVDITDTLPAAGTYYIHVALSAGSIFGPPDPSMSRYNMWVRLEP